MKVPQSTTVRPIVDLASGPTGAGASPFLLAPFAAGGREITRRQELLRKRNQRLKIGFDETDLPPEQQLAYIR